MVVVKQIFPKKSGSERSSFSNLTSINCPVLASVARQNPASAKTVQTKEANQVL
jgi:hypothetical protein